MSTILKNMETSIEIIKSENDLGLSKLIIEDIPNDILFPEELVQYLRGQIQFLTQSNARLQQSLEQKDIELRETESKAINLSNKLSEYEVTAKDLNGVASNSRITNSKIVELSKKLREKNSELETWKTKCSKLQTKVTEFENNFIKEETPKVVEISETAEDIKTEHIKSLQEKLSTLNTKLFETKNQNLQLKNDLKLANKMLLQELGDSFISVQNYSTGTTNWRGRSQQILSLQQKNNELSDRLSVVDKDSTIVSTPKQDNRKQIIEQLNKDINNIKVELEEVRKKFNAAKARVKVLESENYSLKTKLTAHTEKVVNSEQLIKCLQNQINSLEESQKNILKESQSSCEIQIKTLNMELNKEKCKIENLKRIVTEKDNTITELKEEMQQNKNSSHHSSPKISKKNSKEYLVKINILEVELQRMMELVTVLNQRLEDERLQHGETQLIHRRERQKAAKLETKLQRMEMESNMFKSQNYARSSVKNSSNSLNSEDNGRLALECVKNSLELAEENIKALEARLIILQREKDLDFQRFSAILNDTQNILRKHDLPS